MSLRTSHRGWTWRGVAIRSVAALAGVAVFILAVATPSEGLVGLLLRGCVVMVGTGLVSASLEL